MLTKRCVNRRKRVVRQIVEETKAHSGQALKNKVACRKVLAWNGVVSEGSEQTTRQQQYLGCRGHKSSKILEDKAG